MKTKRQQTPYAKKLRQFKNMAKRALRLMTSGDFEKLPEERQWVLTRNLRNLYNLLIARVSSWSLRKWALKIAAILGFSTVGFGQANIQFAPALGPNPFGTTTVGSFFSPRSMDLVDIDNDGDYDLFIGANNPTLVQYCYYYNGNQYCYYYTVYQPRLFYFENTGTAAAPTFAAPIQNPFNLNVSGNWSSVSPQFADIDGDGDYDAFMSQQYGYPNGIRYFPNIGTPAAPNFGAMTINPFGINVGGYYSYGFPKVVFADINDDGDLDLFSGKLYYGNSNITYQPNNGTAGLAAFGTAQNNPFGIVPQANSYRNGIDLVDIDWDGDLDFFAQNYSFYSGGVSLRFFQNTGSATAPTFATSVSNPFGITPPANRPTDIDFVDMDGDSDPDLFIMDNNGGLYYYENTSTRGSIEFTTQTFAVNEPVGGLFLELHLTNPSGIVPTDTATVELQLLSGSTATSGIDFSFTPPITASFPPGFTGPFYVNIPIINDNLVEANEQFQIQITNASPGFAIGVNDTITVTITDDDINAPQLQFNAGTMSVNENAGTINFDVQLNNPNANATSVTVIAAPSSATLNLDYFFNGTTVTFPAGNSTPQTLSLNIVDDLDFESTEDIVLHFSNPTNGAAYAANDSIVISIQDNDIQPPGIEFGATTFTVDENVGLVNLQININTPNANATEVDLRISGASTAIGGLDFNIPISSTLTFPGSSSTPISFDVPITDDIDVESQEMIVLNLVNPTNGAVIGTNSSITIFINDNDVSAIGSTGWGEDALQLFPNPVIDQLNIELADFENKELKLVDINGRSLINMQAQKNLFSLDLSALAAGVYFVHIQDTVTGQFMTKRIVKD